MAVVAAISALAGTAYGIHANEQAKKETDQAARQQMEANTKAAEAEADRISFNADKLKKAQRASAAKAGLVTNVGTALDVQKETDFLAGKDIRSVMETKDARNQGVLSEAKLFKHGRDASSANMLFNFADTALGAYDTYKKNNNFIGQQEASAKSIFGTTMFKTGPSASQFALTDNRSSTLLG